MLAIGVRVEIRQRLRIARGPFERGPERRQRLHRHDPGRERGGEVLRQERAERLVFPGLDVARRPVVEQRDAEQMLLGLVDRDRLAERIALADEEAELELVVEPLRWRRARAAHRRALGLAARALEVLAADADRRGAAVIADRHPLVVGHQRVVGAEQLADRGRVMDAGVEVGVVADAAGHVHLDARIALQGALPGGLLAAALGQAIGDRARSAWRFSGAGGHQRVHVVGVDQAGCSQVEHLVADRDADAQAHQRRPPCESARTAGSGSGSRSRLRWPRRPSCAASGRGFR